MELGQQDETLEESTSREVQLSLKTPISPRHDHDGSSYTNGKVVVIRYKECQKNHAAAIGGNATDGCGEFMPAGEEGSIDALVCSACSCHRNFHRKEIEHCIASHGDNIVGNNGMGVEYVVGQSNPNQSRSPVANNSENNNEHQHKKRFRTKFTAEQKERMVAFAEKAGWKIQKLDESVVQQFCREIGIKRRVLKVWMHNNKHSFAKKPSSSELAS